MSDAPQVISGIEAMRGVGQQRGRHHQWLGNRGIGDLLGARGGSESNEIQAGYRRPAVDTIPGAGEVEPFGEHAGSLRALSGREKRNHISKRTL